MVITLSVENYLLYQAGLSVASLAAACLVLQVMIAPASRLSVTLAWPPLASLGRVSYGVYLWHHPIAFAAAAVGTPWWLGTGLGLPLGIAFAILSYRLIEAPALRLKHRLRTRKSTLDLRAAA
ncbi:MAG: hypothetical protein EXR52_06090 [Dehalococcoidia bacterium]|nr:hypothetical protein [Dehalococcoidia bacterium]